MIRMTNAGREVIIHGIRNDSGDVFEYVFTDRVVGIIGKTKSSHRTRTRVVYRLVRWTLDESDPIIAKWINEGVLPV